ncbi:host attachment protein [bacterium]|nr:host attachment protein [bacterium]
MNKVRTRAGNSVPDLRLINTQKNRQWYVVANRTGATIYRESQQKFEFLKRLSNPEGRLPESKLDSDRAGRAFARAADGTIRHSLDRAQSHHEKSAKDFAMRIARTLELAMKDSFGTEITLVAEPHFLGLLRNALSPNVRALIKNEINREYSRGSNQELYRYVQQALKQTQEREVYGS